MGADLDVVEAHHRDVPRRLRPVAPQRAEEPHRHLVGGEEEGRGTVARRRPALRRQRPAVHREVALEHPGVPRLQPAAGHRLAPALLAGAGEHVAARPRHMADAPVAEAGQMRHRQLRPMGVVDPDRGQVGRQPLAGRDHRRAARNVERGGREPPVEQHQPVGHARGEIASQPLVRVRPHLGVGDQEPVVARAEHRRHSRQDLAEERVREVRGQRDHAPRPLPAQVPGQVIDLVAGLLHRPHHRLPGGLGHHRGLGERAADGGRRDAGLPRDVLDRDRSSVHPRPWAPLAAPHPGMAPNLARGKGVVNDFILCELPVQTIAAAESRA